MLVIPAQAGIALDSVRGEKAKSDSRLRGNDKQNRTGWFVHTIGTMLLTLAVLTACLPPIAFAQANQSGAPVVYRNPAEEARFHDLTKSLRCVMCQNESLADSQALIAHDLRRQILAMMRDGRSDAQIRAFLVARYGEFVLYRPRVEPATWLLWFGPPVLLLAGAFVVFVIVRRRSARVRLSLENGGEAAERGAGTSAESSEDW